MYSPRYRRIGRYQRDSKVFKIASELASDLKLFGKEFSRWLFSSSQTAAVKFSKGKNYAVTSLYRQRGKMAKRLVHSGMAGIAAFGVMVAPIVAEEFPGSGVDPWEAPSPSQVLSASDTQLTETIIAEHDYRDRVIEYEVKEGDTVSTIGEKFGISIDTIRWQNDLPSRDSIKIGQVLGILPVTGVSHKVVKGDTVYSIAKKYDVDPQVIVNYPFNVFVDDETFELAIGQVVIVPDGIKPEEIRWSPVARVRQITPDAGTVVASGNFVWPASGSITQNFAWYHRGLDIANRSAPSILAADAGRVVVAGWPDGYGYGNRVVIDHGNGMRTLYAHMSAIYVAPGQSVNRGDAIGKMGSTGRSTGTHLHFEAIQNGVNINPLSVLR
jgi:murein DD-endopeptidase MepM/ murein hydrolase activator NlpD